jgi:hypothetical protein
MPEPFPASAVNPYPGYRSAIYSDPANWLCRPDEDDVCDHDLDATVVKANGHTSDLIPGDDQELFVVRRQAARLGSVFTLTSLVEVGGDFANIPRHPASPTSRPTGSRCRSCRR